MYNDDQPNSHHALITGGAGFIGSHLAEHLVASGSYVTVIDDLSTGRLSNLNNIDASSIQMIEGKVEDRLSDLDHNEFGQIYHLAAAVGVRLILEQPIKTIETNILETAAILRFADSASIPTLIASSSEVYGKSTKLPFAEDDDVTYGATTFTRWSYACTKAMDEFLALAHHQRQKLPVVIARFFNTVGPRQLGDYGMVLPRFVKAAIHNEPLKVFGDGAQSRCFCDVRDVVKILPRMIQEKACHGRVFNIGSDTTISILELANTVIHELNSQSVIEFVPYVEAYGQGFEDLAVRQPDLSRLTNDVGFNPSISLQQTIKDLADNLRG